MECLVLNKDFIQVYPDFIEESDIDKLYDFLYSKGPLDTKQIYFLETLNDAEAEIAPNFEIVDEEIKNILLSSEKKVVKQIVSSYFSKLGYEADLQWSRHLELIRWNQFAKLGDHTDAPEPTDEWIPISALIYINDDYVGGEIGFPDYDINIKPKKNDLIVFCGSMNHNVGLIGTDDTKDQRRFTMPFFFDFKIKPYSE